MTLELHTRLLKPESLDSTCVVPCGSRLVRLLLLGDGPLPVEHRGADRGRGQDVRPVDAQAALGIHVAGAAVVELYIGIQKRKVEID